MLPTNHETFSMVLLKRDPLRSFRRPPLSQFLNPKVSNNIWKLINEIFQAYFSGQKISRDKLFFALINCAYYTSFSHHCNCFWVEKRSKVIYVLSRLECRTSKKVDFFKNKERFPIDLVQYECSILFFIYSSLNFWKMAKGVAQRIWE